MNRNVIFFAGLLSNNLFENCSPVDRQINQKSIICLLGGLTVSAINGDQAQKRDSCCSWRFSALVHSVCTPCWSVEPSTPSSRVLPTQLSPATIQQTFFRQFHSFPVNILTLHFILLTVIQAHSFQVNAFLVQWIISCFPVVSGGFSQCFR